MNVCMCVYTCLRRGAHDDLHARVWRVVLPGPFLAVHVSEAVGVALHKLQ